MQNNNNHRPISSPNEEDKTSDCMKDGADRATSGERSRPVKFIGKIIILLTVISFLFVGILINILQVLLLISSKLSDNLQWKRCHKRINSSLVYILFSPPICLLYYWSNASLRIQLDDLKLIEMSTKPSTLAIIVPNHTYVLDYMVCFVLADQLGGVGCYKSMSKEELRYLPVIGWSLWMSDIIFVKRDWQRDRKIIGRKLDNLFHYDQTILGIFAEGTRYSEEKHQLSVEFARSRHLQAFKYHLVPRARGFNYTVRHYLRKIVNEKRRASLEEFKILNLQIVMPDNPRFRDFIEGRQLRADVYCEEVKLSEDIREEVLNSRDEDSCPKLSRLLMDIFRRKDQLVDGYLESGGQFPQNPHTGGLFPYRKSRLTLAIGLAGFCLTYGSLGYLAWHYLAKSALFWTLLTGFIVACVMMLRRIARESKIPKQAADVSGKVMTRNDISLSSKQKLV